MYLFFDTETTGINRRSDHIVQLAWALADARGNIREEECHVIRPDGFSIPAGAERIHGISTAKACEIGKPLAFVLKRLSLAANRANVLIAHNLSFDVGMLQTSYKFAGLSFPLNGKTQVCTMKLSTAWCRLPKLNGSTGFKWPSLDELHYRLFGKGFDGAHDALADTKACMKCYFELVRKEIITPPAANKESESIIISCPECSQGLRIVSGKHLEVTCPKCRSSFEVEASGYIQHANRPLKTRHPPSKNKSKDAAIFSDVLWARDKFEANKYRFLRNSGYTLAHDAGKTMVTSPEGKSQFIYTTFQLHDLVEAVSKSQGKSSYLDEQNERQDTRTLPGKKWSLDSKTKILKNNATGMKYPPGRYEYQNSGMVRGYQILHGPDVWVNDWDVDKV